jgi:hypothetical protein
MEMSTPSKEREPVVRSMVRTRVERRVDFPLRRSIKDKYQTKIHTCPFGHRSRFFDAVG